MTKKSEKQKQKTALKQRHADVKKYRLQLAKLTEQLTLLSRPNSTSQLLHNLKTEIQEVTHKLNTALEHAERLKQKLESQ